MAKAPAGGGRGPESSLLSRSQRLLSMEKMSSDPPEAGRPQPMTQSSAAAAELLPRQTASVPSQALPGPVTARAHSRPSPATDARAPSRPGARHAGPGGPRLAQVTCPQGLSSHL